MGINIVNLSINLILFIVFFLMLHKLVLKKLGETLAERKKTISEGLENYTKSKEILVKVDNEKNEIVLNAKAEAEEIIRQSKKSAEVMAREILKKADEEVKAMRNKMDVVLEAQKQRLDEEYKLRYESDLKLALENILKETESLKLK